MSVDFSVAGTGRLERRRHVAPERFPVKRLNAFVLGFVVPVLLVSALASVREAFGQPAVVGTSSEARFNWSGKDASGAVETPGSAEVAFTSVTVTDLNAGGTVLKTISGRLVSGANAIPVGGALAGLPGGTLKPWVRISDAAGNWTRWVGGTSFSFDGTAPELPSGLQIQVTVTLGGTP